MGGVVTDHNGDLFQTLPWFRVDSHGEGWPLRLMHMGGPGFLEVPLPLNWVLV